MARRKHRRRERRKRREAAKVTERGRPVTVTSTTPAEPQPGMLNIDGIAVYSTGTGSVPAYNYQLDQATYQQQVADQMASTATEVSPV